MNHAVGVILVNYDGYRFTRQCIDSLLKTEYEDLLIYVVENGSSAEEKLRIKKLFKKFDSLRLVDIKKNCGYSKANQIGMEQALSDKCEYIWVLNNDTLVSNDSVSQLVDAYEEYQLDKYETLVSSIVTFEDGQLVWSNGMYDLPLLNFPKSKDKFLSVEKVLSRGHKIINTQYVSSCSVLVHRNYCKRHELFPDDYFIYYDDLDWSGRGTNWIIQRPLVKHLVSATGGVTGSDRFTPFKAYWYGKNSIRFYFHVKRISWFERLVFLSVTLPMIMGLYVRDVKSMLAFMQGIGKGLWEKH